MMDAELTHGLNNLFHEWGETVLLGAAADKIARTPVGDPEVVLSNGARFRPGTILFAADRTPKIEELDRHAAGVRIDSRGQNWCWVIGAAVLRELSKYDFAIGVLERNSEVAQEHRQAIPALFMAASTPPPEHCRPD